MRGHSKVRFLIAAWAAVLILGSCASHKNSSCHAGKKKVKTLWNSCDGCAQPESAYIDPVSKFLFVSNVDGDPIGKDAKGGIQKFSLDGKIVDAGWVTGLNAPKGIRSIGDTLFVADIDEIISISIQSGKILKRAKAPGAVMLNDIAVKGQQIFVSDTLGSKIYVWNQKSAPKVFMAGDQLEAPNGLLMVGNDLFVAAWGIPAADWSTKIPGNLLKIDSTTKKITKITTAPLGNLDGIEIRANGNFLVSDWMAGKVYEITPAGQVAEILSGFKGAADLAWDEATSTLILPRMGENKITAFRL